MDAYGDAIPAAYRQADQILGEVMALLGPESHLVLVSDHGFQALRPGEGKAFFAPLTARLQERISAEVGPVDISRMGAKLNVGLVDDALEPAAAREYIESLLAADGRPFFRVDEVPGNERALGLTLTDEDLTEEKIAAGTVGGEPLADYV